MAGRPNMLSAAAAAVLWAACGAGAAGAEPHPVTATLLADAAAVRPGATFTVGVLFEITGQWHIYWRNPGDAGLATAVEWTLPKGFRAGALRWPVPKRFKQPGDIVGYGYEGSVLLTAEITAPGKLPLGSRVTIAAEASWLACRQKCLPGEASLSLELPVTAAAAAAPANAGLFARWAGLLPVEADAQASPLAAKITGGVGGGPVRMLLTWRRRPPAKLQWFPAATEAVAVEDVRLRTTGRRTRIDFTVRILSGRTPPEILETVVVFTDVAGRRRGVRLPVRLRPPDKLAEADKSQPAPPTAEQLIRTAVQQGEDTWKLANNPTRELVSRELFRYALALCEAKMHPERLAVLFGVAAKMQDRNPESRTYGNFQWFWQEGEIKDRNAVDFCMMGGSLMWLRHRDTMPADARKALREILNHAVEGCLRHRVSSSYTNIAFMNALDLILLGEGLGRKDVADEGYARLERALVYTWEWGTHEYCSPTYYGVDVEVLQLIEAFCKRDSGRQQARALLELLWTDIAANWYAPTDRIGGTRSRDYSYLHGTGPLDTQTWLAGWLGGEHVCHQGVVYPAVARWQPPARLREMNLTRYPRLVRQSWGPALGESRTFYLCKDVGLSISGALYNFMDLPLTVDLLGGRDRPRCYFIPDGRHDPYGQSKIAAGAHRKTLHLRPFWTGAQRRVDALGLVVYRRRDLPKEFQTLESHIVLRRDMKGFWIGDRKVDLSGKEAAYDVPVGTPLVMRHGTAAVGIRVLWAYGLSGKPVGAKLVYDGNEFDVVRLTVAHHGEAPVDGKGTGQGDEAVSGAAFWVRVGSGLRTTEQFEKWRREFAAAKASAAGDREKVRLQIAGVDGPVVVAASAPWREGEELTPAPTSGVLEIDGKDVGREILGKVEAIREYVEKLANLPAARLRDGEGTFMEAESGLVIAEMVVARDAAASGGAYVWTPGESGKRGSASGSILWELRVDKAATYYLWGRVLTPTSADDSFDVRVLDAAGERIGGIEWHTGISRTWGWSPARHQNAGEATGLPLPAGKVRLEIRTREDGAKIDRLYLTTDPEDRPE